HPLDRAWLTRAISEAEPPPSDGPAQPAPAEPGGVPRIPLPAPARTPTPGDLARSAPAVALRWSSDSGWAESDDWIPLLETLTTPSRCGRTVSKTLRPTTPPTSWPDWTQAHPRIPRSVDSELLRYAARFGTIGVLTELT
ncbi:NYN domain-containing protein, partial [Streptomyces sp. NPDC001356]